MDITISVLACLRDRDAGSLGACESPDLMWVGAHLEHHAVGVVVGQADRGLGVAVQEALST